MRQGEDVWAARLWGKAEAVQELRSVARPPVDRASYEQAVATARDHLGEPAFSHAWAAGRAMTVDQVLRRPEHAANLSQASAVPALPTAPAGLTARELEVLRLVAQGRTNAQIAQALYLGEPTVANHLTHIYRKISVDNRAGAAAFASQHHLI
jgi:DNA-binding CsgD family transcriptional regulator